MAQNSFPQATDVIRKVFTEVDYIVNKSYLPLLEKSRIVSYAPPRDIGQRVCFFPINKIVYDREENNLEKLANVYSCAAVAGINVAMLVRSSSNGNVEIYLGAYDENGDRVNSTLPKAELLYNSFVGNFPGSQTDSKENFLDVNQTENLIDDAFSTRFPSIAAVSGVASLRGKQDNSQNEKFYRGIEKIIEGMNGKEYTILILAKAVNHAEIEGVRVELESLYTQLSPFAKTSCSISRSEGDSVTKSIADSISKSFTNTTSDSMSIGESQITARGNTKFSSVSRNAGANIGNGVIPAGISVGTNVADGMSTFDSKNQANIANKTHTQTSTDAQTTVKTTTEGTTVTVTKTQSVQLNYENKKVSEMIASIDLQLKRLKIGEGLGMFAVAAYFSAPTLNDTKTVAAAYKAIISGDNTYVEQACVNVWNDAQTTRMIRNYLHGFNHPVFSLGDLSRGNITATPATIVSVPEMTLCMNLPQKSVSGIPVYNGVSFGRNVVLLNKKNKQPKKLDLGKVFHLGLAEQSEVKLDLNSLTMHTFITGTTGSGKSNTVYEILDGIREVNNRVHFLVIEPAKGEYKMVFGNRKNVAVYGINYRLTPLLKINPFRFREDVHVLEHLDKLIGIFNVCWPMEAAMPAILKQALERSYERAGWNLRTSENSYSSKLFPTFTDVMKEVEGILNDSLYSEENKGNYIGALCTRLRELTTGLNGMVFVSDDLTDEELFERNVIIDLSRIWSAETKSLIMGLIVIRLQEYRQSTQISIKTGLNHITVLEEAHHLLRRTTGNAGGSNLAGKSVEMLTNGFAEMRSSGEGFIIADQSPGLLDMSVIRNTNTKIVMRLPAFEDREHVGKAMGLTEIQMSELSKLPTGVAAVYQNDWLSSVLVQIPEYDSDDSEGKYNYKSPKFEEIFRSDEILLLDALMQKNGIESMVNQLKGGQIDGIANLHLPTKVKCCLIDYVKNNNAPKLERLGRVAFDFFNMREAVMNANADNIMAWKAEVLKLLRPSIEKYDDWDQDTLLLLLSSEYARRVREFQPIYLGLVKNIL